MAPAKPMGHSQREGSTSLPDLKLQKSASAPSVRSSQASQLPRLLGKEKSEKSVRDAKEKEPRPARPERPAEKAIPESEVDVNRKMRRELLEVLSNPSIRSIAAKYYQEVSGKGRLGFRDLRTVLKALNKHLGLPLPATPVAEQLFKRFDFNGDGDLSFDEFFELFVTSLRRVAFDRSVLLGREVFVTQEPGKVWDVYQRVKTLGEGSFGSAHLGKHKRTKEERVVKVVMKSQAKLPVEDIEKEIMVLRQVDHPHIIRLHEWYEGSSKIYLVMDAIKGGTLREALLSFQREGQPVAEAWSRRVAQQVLQAMAYCHGMRIIHKDLKDENVMLLKGSELLEPFVVIIDLGVSEMFSSSDPHGKCVGGTPMTMAPEVWDSNFGPKCDVWSVGCLLFEMLTGSLPFVARSMSRKDWQALHRLGPDWRKVKTSTLSRKMCQEMLTYSDRERPSMVQCLQHKWFAAQEDALGAVDVEQLKPLQDFAQETAMRRAVIMEVASKLPIERAERIAKVFEKLDENQDGGISLEEMQHMFNNMGLKDKALQSKAFQALDINGDGVLSFSEFAAGVLTVFHDLLEERFLELFRRYDLDCDGMLSRAELEGFLQKVLPLTSRSVQQSPGDAITKLFGKVEVISFEELRTQLLPSTLKKRK
ncbi:unnamed protein product [Effrenium voratum]|uniref:non-specific serine/threonine protein kinase n=1 Tax=Effrenium voratum TaxID=2562239 RepID=A0AA36JFR1_9DINO|nr:unnamed protein product [Effrenium voratum]CAJ1422431.1 unnamed protein product [Effrenium voratum]